MRNEWYEFFHRGPKSLHTNPPPTYRFNSIYPCVVPTLCLKTILPLWCVCRTDWSFSLHSIIIPSERVGIWPYFSLQASPESQQHWERIYIRPIYALLWFIYIDPHGMYSTCNHCHPLTRYLLRGHKREKWHSFIQCMPAYSSQNPISFKLHYWKLDSPSF